MKTFTVSAPGKLHLLGEHAVVYVKPAIIAAVDKRCYVDIAEKMDKKISITIFGNQNRSSWFAVHGSQKDNNSSTVNGELTTHEPFIQTRDFSIKGIFEKTKKAQHI